MKQTNNSVGTSTPTANITINKSRIKLYKNTDEPTYYLQKGQEFEIELFNPTQGNILAKITLNNKPLSQGGLVLRPGERVFVERYLDVAKKFLFDTYEVSNSEEVKKAIEKNGDFKVEFYKERTYPNPILTINNTGGYKTFTNLNNLTNGNTTYTTTTLGNTNTSIGTSALSKGVTNTSNTNIGTSAFYSSSNINSPYHDGMVTMDWMDQTMERSLELPKTRCAVDRPKEVKCSHKLEKKTVETGRVEKGSNSDQQIKQVQMDFEYYSFHSIEAKLLPISQKINTSKDLNVRQYCTNCGHKAGKNDNFCSSCGKKI